MVCGLTFLKALRGRGDVTPVIILTALDQVSDRIDGLNAGADDYLVKPFDLAELSARIGSVARRYTGNPNPIITHGALEIDRAAKSIRRDGKPVALTAREWALFDAFLARPGQLLSKAQLEEKLYAFDVRGRKQHDRGACQPPAQEARQRRDRDRARPRLPAGRAVRTPLSLQARLGISLGLLLTLLWIAAAFVTALSCSRRRSTRSSIPLFRRRPSAFCRLLSWTSSTARMTAPSQRLGAVREHEEYFTYVVRDPAGRVLLQSHAAEPDVFPPYDGSGFRQTEHYRIYNDDALKGSVRHIDRRTARSPRQRAAGDRAGPWPAAAAGHSHRNRSPSCLRSGASLAPLRRFRARLSARSGRDLSAVPADDLPAEIAPVAAALNDVLARLKAAFEAERSFAAHAAHELRTPLAGAIAQAQRLRSETSDPAAAARAAEIEATLKRLTRLSERLMQLARAEGGRLRIDSPRDLRPTARLVAEDTARSVTPDRIAMSLPETPVLSDLDPDAFGILLRNLIENALRHGAADGQVAVTLAADGTLRVANDGPVVPPEVLVAPHGALRARQCRKRGKRPRPRHCGGDCRPPWHQSHPALARDGP